MIYRYTHRLRKNTRAEEPLGVIGSGEKIGCVLKRKRDTQVFVYSETPGQTALKITAVENSAIGLFGQSYHFIRREILEKAGHEYKETLECMINGEPLTESMIKGLQKLVK